MFNASQELLSQRFNTKRLSQTKRSTFNFQINNLTVELKSAFPKSILSGSALKEDRLLLPRGSTIITKAISLKDGANSGKAFKFEGQPSILLFQQIKSSLEFKNLKRLYISKVQFQVNNYDNNESSPVLVFLEEKTSGLNPFLTDVTIEDCSFIDYYFEFKGQ